MDNKKLTDIKNLIFEAAVVKRVKRTGWMIMGDHEEGVGEHTFMTCVIAYLLAKEIQSDASEARGKISMETVLIMSVFHDFHEARTGDLDKIAKLYMTRDQDRANADIFNNTDNELLDTLTTYEKKETMEAKIAYEANVLAFLVELKVLMERGNTHAAEWFEGNAKRLRLDEAIALANEIRVSDSHDWWKSIRKTLHEEFAQ
jgi:putative hydrolases of HD superfamily